MTDRKLKVFLCHASQDKPVVRELCQRLAGEGWIDPWLDAKKLLPGQDWREEIEKAVDAADSVIIFLSSASITKEGFVQKEMRYAREMALEKPEGSIFLIPVRLDACEAPRGLRFFQWVDYFGEKKEQSYGDLLESLKIRLEEKLRKEAAEKAKRAAEEYAQKKAAEELARKAAQEKARAEAEEKLRLEAEERARQELMKKIEREARKKVRLEMEERLRLEAEARARDEYAALEKARDADAEKPVPAESPEISIIEPAPEMDNPPAAVSVAAEIPESLEPARPPSPLDWKEPSPPPDRLTLNGVEFCRIPAGSFLMGSADSDKNADNEEKPQHQVEIPYDYWLAHYPVTNAQYAQYVNAVGAKHPLNNWQKKTDHPVTRVRWDDAMDYCQWLNDLSKEQLPQNYVLRLPGEAEWEKAARRLDGCIYPWENAFNKNKCNAREGGKGGTTPVGLYSPQGDSPYGCADMSGNVWEWTHSIRKPYPYKADDGREDEKSSSVRVLRGGSFIDKATYARCACRLAYSLGDFNEYVGFRVALAQPFS